MSSRTSRSRNIRLWTVQVLLALAFLFAGGLKLAMPIEALAQASGFSGAFMRVIAVAEIAGALGLVLPGVFAFKRQLTPFAAAGLSVIMIGAVIVSVIRTGAASAIVPAVMFALLVTVIRGRFERPSRRFHPVSFDVPLKARRAR